MAKVTDFAGWKQKKEYENALGIALKQALKGLNKTFPDYLAHRQTRAYKIKTYTGYLIWKI